MKSYTIQLVRHGETRANEEGIYAGVTDYPLSGKGISALKRLKRNNVYPDVEVVYTSPLKRCVETCEILYPDVKQVVIPEFIECNFGDWEGKTVDELKYDKRFIDWLNSNKGYTPPNAESSQDFSVRICKAFDKLVEELLRAGTTKSAMVMHGGAIMILLTFYGLPRANFSKWRTESGRGYSVRVTPSLWMRSKVMEVYDTVPAKK